MKVLSPITLLFVLCFVIRAQQVKHIDLTKAKFEEVNAERIFDDLEIIPLETHKDALLQITANFYLTNNYILAISFLKAAYLFDKKTGKFIREISKEVQGPNEYSGWIYNISGLDEKNNIIFANDGLDIGGIWKGINLVNKKIEYRIKRPVPENEDDIFVVQSPWLLKDNMYLSFANNRTGKDKNKLIVSDKEGNIIRKYPNYLQYKKESRFISH